MPASKNSLDIRLTESVVFLRGGDGTGRNRRGTQPNAPPAMIRGLLTLTLGKPTRISSIEVELTGKTSTTWPEGAGARRVEINEDHKIYSQTCVFYKAGSTPHSHPHRRTLSVGPGLHLDHDYDHVEQEHGYDDDSDESSDPDHASVEERRGRQPIRDAERGRAIRRMHSVDQHNFQTDYVEHHRNTQLPTPPYSPPYSPTPLHRSPAPSVITPISPDDSPRHSMEEIRRGPHALAEYNSYRGRSSSRTPAPSIYTPVEGSLSRRVSFEERPPEFVIGSSTQPPSYVHPSAAPAQVTRVNATSPHRTSPHAGFDEGRGRKGKRSSLGMFFDAVKDRVRSVSRADHDTPPHSLTRENSVERMDRSLNRRGDHSLSGKGRTREAKERSTLERVSEVLGLEVEANEVGEGWKEFRKGVYTYPISFAIPANSPPTLQCEFGTVEWQLKAYAHRPGTFTAKLSATKDVTVVACPGEDDTEETESIIVERQWESQMQYLIAISGRSFPIGGIIPFSITFIPWTKMKVFRLSVVIEERVDYYTEFKRLMRTDPIKRIVLLSLRDPHKDHPLLPLESDEIEDFKKSALYGSVNSDEDLSEVISSLMGPGPWSIRKNIELPKSCSDLHFTNKNKRSNITISHTLKVIFRVQRGDDQEVDATTGKRKMFDIVVQTPIHILSCLCSTDYTALPPYSEWSSGSTSVSAQCLCRAGSTASPPHEPPLTSRSDSIFLSPDSGTLSRAYSGTTRSISGHTSSTSSESVITSATRPPLPHFDSILNSSSQFERLIAGQESEVGEAPPSYEEVITPHHYHHHHHRHQNHI